MEDLYSGGSEDAASRVFVVPDLTHIPVAFHAGDTAVEQYVRDVVEHPDPLPEGVLLPVMKALAELGVSPPVSAVHLAVALRGMGPTAVTLPATYPNYFARALKALNGPDWTLVPKDVLTTASVRERVIASSRKGWGTSSPPVYATCFRLLVSAGLPYDLLPPYKKLPVAVRTPLDHTWHEACKVFGWDAGIPAEDVPHRSRRFVQLRTTHHSE